MFGLFKKKMVDQDDFTAGPYVAVWVGNHTSEEQLDVYLLGGAYSDDFRFRLNDRNLPEVFVADSPRPLSELIRGFSCYEKFQNEFLETARKLGVFEARSILIFHFMAYSPEGLPVAKNAAMRFMGNFWFEGFE